MLSAEYVKARRADLSSFLVHLTRQYDGRSARQSLLGILRAKQIKAMNFCCIFQRELEQLEGAPSKPFKVVCFTETPLGDINYLSMEMAGRTKQLKPYGLVFRKKSIINAGGNPVFYLTTSSSSGKKRQAALWNCFKVARKAGLQYHEYASFLPLVNKVDATHDFSFEREWRVVGDFRFLHRDVFLGLAPVEAMAEMEGRFRAFPWVSPRWGRDQIIEKLRGWKKQV